MKVRLLILTLITLASTLNRALFAEDDKINEKTCTRDYQAVEDFLNSKRIASFSDKEKMLRISGDIRATYLDRCETHGDEALRGHGAKTSEGLPIPHKTYEAVLNLRFDYRNGTKTWAAAYLNFDNSMGIQCTERKCPPKPVVAEPGNQVARSCGGGCGETTTVPLTDEQIEDKHAPSGTGRCNDLCLKRCYAGINLYSCEGAKLDVEVGRRPMYTVFDSRIEFHARFDGMLFKLSKFVKGWGNYYFNGGPFVVDYRVDHFNGVFELGVIDLYEVGVDIKYSYLDWRGRNKCEVANPLGFRYANSQWSLAYNVSKELIPRKMKFYSAFLLNHDAKPFNGKYFDGKVEKFAKFGRENTAWYAGFIIGEVLKKYDWSLDVNYQFVRPQSIPDCDVHGIGRGNLRKESFTRNLRGKANYKGWHFEGLYAVTDKVSLDLLFEHSKEVTKRAGGRHTFTQTEFDVIVAY